MDKPKDFPAFSLPATEQHINEIGMFFQQWRERGISFRADIVTMALARVDEIIHQTQEKK